MYPDSLLVGANADFLDSKYREWLNDPSSVEPEWQQLFSESTSAKDSGRVQPPGPDTRSIFAPKGTAGGVDEAAVARRAGIVQYINAFRVRGHFKAEIDPLSRRVPRSHPELTLEYYGLTDADLDISVETSPLFGLGKTATIREIRDHLEASYCGTIGAEFMNIDDWEQKLWVERQLEELPHKEVLNHQEELRVLRKLSDAENFERLIHVRFPGTKRFSLEGGETLIPLLDLLISDSAQLGAKEIVLGMAHRGRLNVLVNTLEKPAWRIIEEFEDSSGPSQGSGDVKYHLGYSSNTKTVHGHEIHLSLTPNPSHLEAVDPVVEGRVRAKQDRVHNVERDLCVPVLIHGDAAFVGQGSVAETLQLSELEGYRTGGTIHIVVNNQIGFTTAPKSSRSTPYATDFARMLGIPIFHVNGEDPRAVAAAVRIAVEWRQKFHRDVVVDMYCYRKHGHNEGDEPSFTQPLMYGEIRRRPTPRENYASKLMAIGYTTKDDVERIQAESRADLDALADKPENADISLAINGNGDSSLRERWKEHTGGSLSDDVDTSVPEGRLRELLIKCNEVPEGFTPHNKVKRLIKQRLQVANGERAFDWGMAEQAAFATLVADGYHLRLSGQDSGRGTFSHRHAVWTDITSGDEHIALQNLSDDQGRFNVYDSNLSEFAVLGFEFGYSLDTPDGVTLWEAQFGDFSNGAQVIFDQFISSAEQKWARQSNLVMLLPHGFEGQGPEHSSARLERYLLQAAQDNIQVANCTTPANYFHLLRLQAVRKVRKPLVLMTPKSLLRHPRATSTMSDLADGRFQPVIADPRGLNPADADRVIFCSGHVYYDLIEALEGTPGEKTTLIHRVEQLHPFPADAIAALLQQAPDTATVVWAQEEPRNMGAWPVLLHYWMEQLPTAPLPQYAGRLAAASPATGSHHQHHLEQRTLVSQALGLDVPN